MKECVLLYFSRSHISLFFSAVVLVSLYDWCIECYCAWQKVEHSFRTITKLVYIIHKVTYIKLKKKYHYNSVIKRMYTIFYK